MTIDAVLHAGPVIPVIVIDQPDHAVPLARALADGGLPVAEITFRTGNAAESLRRIAAEKALSDPLNADLKGAAEEFKQMWR